MPPTKKIGRGAFNAIRTDLETSSSEYVVVTMADLSDHPSVINNMIQKAQKEGADLFCGSRYMNGGKQIGGPLLKRTRSRMADVSLKYLINFSTHGVTNSFKLYKKQTQDSILIIPLENLALGCLSGSRVI